MGYSLPTWESSMYAHCKRYIALPGVWHFGTYEMHLLRHIMTHIIGHCTTPYKTSAATLYSHIIYDRMLGQIHFLPGSSIS